MDTAIADNSSGNPLPLNQEYASAYKAIDPAPYDDDLGAALMDSLRNMPDPMLNSAPRPRGKKNPVVTLDSIKKELSYECKLCGKRYRKSADFFQHELTHGKPLPCDKCSEHFFKPWELTKHRMEKHSDSQLYECETCSKTFIENWRLLRHLRTHSKEKKFKCEICEKSFAESGNLAKHKKQVHTKDRPFKCDVCDKTYPQKKDLQSHMVVHTIKRFSCSVCKLDFSLLEEKRAHVKTVHPSEVTKRSFICALCSASFDCRARLKDHWLTHGERRFNCKFCPKKFHTHARLRKHMRSHRVEEHSRCEICAKSFSQDSNMTRHIELMHMRDGRYFCMHCPLTFTVPAELKAHRETHPNEKAYKCSFCEKAFFHHQSLANHTKCHRNPKRHLKEFITPVSRQRRVRKKPNIDINGRLPDDISSTDKSSSNSELAVPLQPKKRGRPKKIVTATTDTVDDALDEAPSNNEDLLIPLQPKKRGRPKKVKVTNELPPVSFAISAQSSLIPTCTEIINAAELVVKTEQPDLIDIGPTVLQEANYAS
ncbi:zinc finger protein ZFP2-like [Topomyia yanbarensis]|uniref:zinc finger protein ZFP2-like n=1 Tax=Topomyia yanbarensis TaxID=2498891 RepID=UPI00273C68FD|nr:zinc finger protein ZFP2-like [Topomyia yanbarensis]XP_058834105.1 zinc finger protein ZFP2-like [Topomyia yanbarensis]